MANIALLPGGFKPPHAGHYAVAKYLSQKSGAEILVRVGAKKRDDITQAMSIKIWGIYGVEAEPAASDSPIADVFKYVEEKATEEDTIYVGTGEKDYPRFKVLTDPSFKPDNYKKYNPKGVKVIEISIPPQAGGVSGTKMREFIMNDQKDLFQKYLPDHIDKDKIWNIVLDNIQEDLYNPNDHVLDYMKSSEFKAGYTKKDDVPPGYKYRRGGQYSAASGQGGAGSMYEDAQYETGKVLHVYDFDDTIAQVKANIKTTITSPSDPNFLQKLDIASTEFPEESKELEARLGSLEIKYDFSEFEKQIGDAIVNSKVVSKLKDSLSRSDIKTTILTARSIGHPVTRYLKRDLGLDAYVVPLGLQVDGKVTGQDKANWIEKHINKGYQTIYFIDDSEENRTAVLALKDKYPDIRLKVEDPAAVREMRGTMNNQEKAKHSKNLKRLSKDLKKQGDQYMEVPDYLKGTLKRKMYEKVTEDSVICDNCGWTWKIVDGGSDLYICHKCNHDNTPINENFPPYKADQVQKVRYQASDTFTNSPKQAKKRGYLEGDTYEKMAAKGKKAGNLKQGTVRKRLKIKDGEKIPLSRITKAISNLKKRKSLNDKDKKYLKALNLAKTLKTTTHKESISEADPKKGTGKKPKGSGRRLYTDENPSDTVKVKFSTRQDIVDTLNKASFKNKPHKRQSQIINLIHQRVRAALNRAKDPEVKKRLKPAFEYIKKRKETSKNKTQRLKKENVAPNHDGKSSPFGSGYKPVDEKINTTHEVIAKGLEFIPKSITINKGDTIKFINKEGIHNVNGDKSHPRNKNNPGSFKNQVGKGWTFTVKFSKSGIYNYHCDPHLGSDMVGTIKVKEAPKNKTQRMRKESSLTKSWWKEQLTEILTETKANTHLTHLEELILTQGQDGYNQAKAFLYELIKNLKGEDNSIKNVSVKWDGAPAIFTGINPENGKFFVGTKSVFNVNPKINYTPQDIDKNHGHAAGLAKKLKLALQYLPAVGIKGILQGDFMFDSDDVKTDDIDGVSHYTFKPNTIRYAVEANSKIGKEILNAKIGIIFHTTYSDLSGGGASFGADTSGLNKSNNVWFDNAYFKDDTGILLNEKEEAFVLEKIKEADSINVNYDALPDEISSRAKTNLLNTYLNQEIRKGEFITDPNKSFETFVNWYKGKIETAVAKISPKNQDKKREVLTNKLKAFIKAKDIVLNLFKVSKLLSEAKNIFIAKYDKAVATKHFIDNGDGTLRVTKAEGFVAVDHTESGIKLVDRLEFSKNNFNAGKPGAKK